MSLRDLTLEQELEALIESADYRVRIHNSACRVLLDAIGKDTA